MVRLQEVSKTYRKGNETVHALDSVSLHIESGEFVAVQGPSGCGKTTLLLSVGGLLRPDNGSVLVDGNSLYEMSLEQRTAFRASKIGFVFQQFHLVPYLSVLDNVLAPTLALPIADSLNRAAALLERFNMCDRSKHTPGELSTGERQRVALARAMLHEPSLILADEPTGNLDEENAAIVMGVLADFADDGGTVLLVTHDNAAASQAGRIVRIDRGQVASGGQAQAGADAQQAV